MSSDFVDMSSLIRMLELRLKRQRESLKQTEEQLAAAYASAKQVDLAANASAKQADVAAKLR